MLFTLIWRRTKPVQKQQKKISGTESEMKCNQTEEEVFKTPKGKWKAIYFEVVKDVADECDKADPVLEGALSDLLTVLEFLL